jgi:hypothetical protein
MAREEVDAEESVPPRLSPIYYQSTQLAEVKSCGCKERHPRSSDQAILVDQSAEPIRPLES